MTEYWWRVTGRRFAPCVDEYDDPVGRGSYGLLTQKLKVLRHTPKGVWLDDFGHERFVLLCPRKRYACPTKAEALESFIARQERRVSILQYQQEETEIGIRMAQQELTDDKEGIKAGTCSSSMHLGWL